ncbi:MAG: cytochrome P450 [Actinobacteria bacterium]|nr:cytochrome P450 [Actinomycetota bacterium]
MPTETVAYEPFGVGALDFDVYQQLLAQDGLYKTETGFYVAARRDDVRDLVRTPKVFSSRPNQSEAMGMTTDGDPRATEEARARFAAMTEGLPVSADDLMSARMIIAADPPLHTHLRRVVNRAFLPRQMDKWSGWIQNRVDELMAAVSAEESFDVVEKLCVPLPVSVIGEVLSLDASEYGRVKYWSDEIMKGSQQADRGSEEASKRLFAAFAEFVARFSPEIEDRRANPRDDIISVLVQKTDEGDISTADALYFLLILMGAGQETTTNLISNMIVSLYENPDQLELLLADPELVKSGIEETLRYRGPAQVTFREALEDTVLGGTEIPAGSLVVGLVGAANHDPSVYEEPLRYDITRDPSHLSFGHGIHFCVGAALARLEAETAMRALLPLLGEMHMSEPPKPIESLILLGFEQIKLAPNS